MEAALRVLHAALAAPRFALAGEDRGALLALRDRLVDDVEGHLAKLADLDAPLLVVLGGVTGAGKSTCVNTLVGRPVVRTGVLRPTTFGPTLIAHPADTPAFRDDHLLPRLPRVEGLERAPAGGERDAGVLRIVPSDALPQGLALVDAPDVDSISTANRDLADSLLDAADLWLWFTTGGKYADEEAMRYLRRARERRTAVMAVLTQVRPADADEIVDDYRRKLAAEGLGDVRVVVVPFAAVHDGRLPAAAVADLRRFLLGLADPAARLAFRRQTLDGAIAALPAEGAPVVAAVEGEVRTRAALGDDVERAYARARADFDDALEQGLPLRAEVLHRWDRFVGSGRLLKLAERASGQARTWLRDALSPAPGAQGQQLEREVRAEVGETLSDLVVQLGDLAAAEVAEGWERSAAGRDLLARQPDLATAAPDLRERAEGMIRDWQATVAELVATRGAERRATARWISGVVNAGATGAILVVLGHTGGLTGAEAGIATVAATANQALLVRLLGEANLRWLLGQARADLTERFARLMEDEARRRQETLEEAAPDAGELAVLRAAIVGVGGVRR